MDNMKNGMSEGEYIKEYVSIFTSLIRGVYWRDTTQEEYDVLLDEGKRLYHETALCPLANAIRLGSPDRPTSEVLRGQKARVKRYKRWLREVGGGKWNSTSKLFGVRG